MNVIYALLRMLMDFLKKKAVNLTMTEKLLLIVVFGFVIRLYTALNAAVISIDSIGYLKLSREFLNGNYKGILDITRPPLYPFLVSVFNHIFKDEELAGRIVSLTAGTLLIPLGFYLAGTIFKRRVALITAFFIAIHPYLVRFSAEVLSESLFHVLAAAVVFFAIKGITEKSHTLFFLSGIFTALAYLTKPGGIVILSVLSVYALAVSRTPTPPLPVAMLRGNGSPAPTRGEGIRKGNDKKEFLKNLSLVFSGWIVFLLLTLPYLLFLHDATGQITIAGKLSITDYLVGIIKNYPAKLENLKGFVKFLPDAFTVPFFLLFIFYMLKRNNDPPDASGKTARRCLLAVIAAYCLLFIIIFPSRRYFVQLMPFFLIFSGAGFYAFTLWLEEKIPAKAGLITVLSLIFIFMAQLPIGMKELHSHRAIEKLAGKWIKESAGSGKKIIAEKPIIAYYADGIFLKLRRDKFTDALKDTDYIAVYRDKLKKNMPEFDSVEKNLLIKVMAFNNDGREFVVYKIRGLP